MPTVLVLTADFHALITALIPVALIVYAHIFLTVPVLRLSKPSMERPYKTPAFSLVSLVCVLTTIVIMSQVDQLV